MIKNKKLKGFTLTELLIVMAIIGILIMIMLPNTESTISKAHSLEAKMQLKHVHMLQKVYRLENATFSSDLDQIGFIQEKLVTEGGKAKYLIEVKMANSSDFVATATSVVDFNNDGNYNTWEIDKELNLVETQRD